MPDQKPDPAETEKFNCPACRAALEPYEAYLDEVSYIDDVFVGYKCPKCEDSRYTEDYLTGYWSGYGAGRRNARGESDA